MREDDPLTMHAVDAGAVHTDRPPLRAYPAHITYANLIAENRRKSAFLVVAMVGLLMLLGAAIALLLAGGRGDVVVPSLVTGAIAAGIVGGLISMWSWFGGANAILSMAGAQEIQKADDPQLFNVVEELAIAAGVPMPRVYLIDDPSLNAFATGRDPQHGAIAITTGLRTMLSRDELAGVIAHEMSHIRHFDIRLSMLMATLAGVIVFAADAARRVAFYGRVTGSSNSRNDNNRGGNPLAFVLVVLAVVLIILAPIVATVLRLAISRQREYLADAGAVELTRYPQGLIGALEKLGSNRQPMRVVNDALAPLFIVNPLKRAVEAGRHNAASMFLTHPPLDERIERLRALI